MGGKPKKGRTITSVVMDEALKKRLDAEVERRKALGEDVDRSSVFGEALEFFLAFEGARVRGLTEEDLEADFPEEDPYQAWPDEDE